MKQDKFTVQVGSPWPPGPDNLHVEQAEESTDSHARSWVMLGITAYLAIMLTIYMIYAMASGSEQFVIKVFEVIQQGLLLLFGFAFGQSSK